MAAKIKARAKFVGRFPGSGSNVSFSAEMPDSSHRVIALPLAKIFRQVMAETYPGTLHKPALRKLTITITFP
jgi:hypothetical protein